MAFATGLELANNTLAFAEHQNVEIMGARGNQVVSGVGVTAQGTPDLTVAVAAGTVLAGGVVVAVSASATFAGTPNTFATSQGNLTSGQAQFVFIHIDSSGVITNTEGTAAVAGQQLPPAVPEDEVILAMLTLTQGDTTIDSVDIEDWRLNVPKGGYFGGDATITGALESILATRGNVALGGGHLTNASPDITHPSIYFNINQDFNGNLSYSEASFSAFKILSGLGASSGDITFQWINSGETLTNPSVWNNLLVINSDATIKNPVNNAGFYTGAGDNLRMYHDGTNSLIYNFTGILSLFNNADSDIALWARQSVLINDLDDANATLFNLDTTARTLTIGGINDNIVTTLNGDLVINSTNPQFIMIENDAAVDNGRWDLFASGENLNIRAVNDANSSATVGLTIARTGTTIDSFTFNANILLGSNGLGNNASVLTFATGSSGLATFGGAITAGGAIIAGGNVSLLASNRKIIFGASSQVEMYFNGTNFIINPQAVGTGATIFTGQFLINAVSESNALTLGTSAAEAISIDEATAEAWNVWSSIRWKEHIKPITEPLKIINQLNPVYYCLKDKFLDKHSNKMGFIAEDLGKILPNIVNWEEEADDDGVVYAMGMDYTRLTALNMAAIKELYKEIIIIKEKLQ